MTFIICEKHNKVEKTADRALVSAHICMNKSCPESLKVFCSNCKNEHKDHTNKILSLEDFSFLLERHLKSPPKSVTKPVSETLEIMKKLKFIKEFRRKIDVLEKELQKYCVELINQTETLLEQVNHCKDSALDLQAIFNNIEKQENYNQFASRSKEFLNNLEYNPKKDTVEFSNDTIKQKQDKRKKVLDSTKRKIEEVRDYSMKIIEVVFHNDDSDDQEDLFYQKKHYEVLKSELYVQKTQEQLNQQIEDLRNSRSTATRTLSKVESNHQECQTEMKFYTSQQLEAKVQQKLTELKHLHTKSQLDYKQRLHAVAREKENLSRQVNRLKQKLDEKKKSVTHIESQLRYNRGIRSQNLKAREDLMNKVIQIWPLRCADHEDKTD